jgi:hypothetical protein
VFDLLFLVINELPATVPVALALIVVELWQLRSCRGRPDRRRLVLALARRGGRA